MPKKAPTEEQLVAALQQGQAGKKASRAKACVPTIIFLAALSDQPHVARMRHDHFMPYFR